MAFLGWSPTNHVPISQISNFRGGLAISAHEAEPLIQLSADRDGSNLLAVVREGHLRAVESMVVLVVDRQRPIRKHADGDLRGRRCCLPFSWSEIHSKAGLDDRIVSQLRKGHRS